MDAEHKKTALRMIPYGLYVLGAETAGGRNAAASVTWVMQSSFEPPLVAVAVKQGSAIHGVVEEAKAFALNVLGKEQEGVATTFFTAREKEGNAIGGEAVRSGKVGGLVLESAAAHLECSVVGRLANGDHEIFVGEVVDVGVSAEVERAERRPDELILAVKDLGEKVFYGG